MEDIKIVQAELPKELVLGYANQQICNYDEAGCGEDCTCGADPD